MSTSATAATEIQSNEQVRFGKFFKAVLNLILRVGNYFLVDGNRSR